MTYEAMVLAYLWWVRTLTDEQLAALEDAMERHDVENGVSEWAPPVADAAE